MRGVKGKVGMQRCEQEQAAVLSSLPGATVKLRLCKLGRCSCMTPRRPAVSAGSSPNLLLAAEFHAGKLCKTAANRKG